MDYQLQLDPKGLKETMDYVRFTLYRSPQDLGFDFPLISSTERAPLQESNKDNDFVPSYLS